MAIDPSPAQPDQNARAVPKRTRPGTAPRRSALAGRPHSISRSPSVAVADSGASTAALGRGSAEPDTLAGDDLVDDQSFRTQVVGRTEYDLNTTFNQRRNVEVLRREVIG